MASSPPPSLDEKLASPTPPALRDDDEDPRELAGVDTSELTSRERRLWWRIARDTPAPCASEAVTVVQCVEERRACAACAPAASFLADRVRRGDPVRVVQAAYDARFTSPVVDVPTEGSPSRGPATAPVTIVIWSDYQCPACRVTIPVIDKIVNENDGLVRLVHELYPLSSHLRAEPAARAAIAAARQNRYWEMEARLFASGAGLEDRDFETYATELGLDLARFRADMRSAATTEWLKRDHDRAEKLGLDGTPFIFINGRQFDMRVFRVDDDLAAWIDLELQLTQQPVAR